MAPMSDSLSPGQVWYRSLLQLFEYLFQLPLDHKAIGFKNRWHITCLSDESDNHDTDLTDGHVHEVVFPDRVNIQFGYASKIRHSSKTLMIPGNTFSALVEISEIMTRGLIFRAINESPHC